MRSSLLIALTLGCSATVSPVLPPDPVADGAVPTDAAIAAIEDAPSPSAPDVARPSTDVPVSPRDAVVCLGDDAPRLDAGDGLSAGPSLAVPSRGNLSRNACGDAWGNGGDAHVRFRAPRAGRWTFTAQGDQLWSFAARSPCAQGGAERACVPYRDFHGGNPFSQPLWLTLRLDAGEEVLLLADGCTGRCAWTLRATQQPDRGCFDPDRTCAMGSRCTVPEGRDESASVCVPGRRPTLGDVRVLRGAGTIRVFGEAHDEDGDFSRVQVTAASYRGGTRPGALPWWVYARDTSTPTVSFAQADARVDDLSAPTVRLVAMDSLGLESDMRVVTVEDAPTRDDGAVCDPEGVRDACRTGSGCTREGRCVPLAAPVLTAVLAHRTSDPVRTALTLRWRDAHDDASAVEVTPLTDGGRGWSLTLSMPPAGVDWVTRWGSDVFGGAPRVRVRLRDRTGRWSEAVEVDVRPPEEAAEGEACDPNGITARCAAGLSCEGASDPRCRR
jgi:hypothetical protein